MTMRRQRGFTLLEILLVVALMSAIVVTVVLNLDLAGPEQKLEREASRLAGVITIALEESQLQGEELGLLVEESSYRVLLLDEEDQWRELQDDKLLTDHQLPEGMSLSLELEDLPWEDEGMKTQGLFDKDDEEQLIPQVFLFSSGELTPFSLTLTFSADGSEEINYRLDAQSYGQITLVDPRWEQE